LNGIYSAINSLKERIKAYAVTIENILNLEILGDDDRPAQWSIPMSENGKMGREKKYQFDDGCSNDCYR